MNPQNWVKFGICVLFACIIALELCAVISPGLRKVCRWGKGSKGAQVSVYGHLAWAGLFAAGLVSIALGNRWPMLFPIAMANVFFALVLDARLEVRRKRIANGRAGDTKLPDGQSGPMTSDQ